MTEEVICEYKDGLGQILERLFIREVRGWVRVNCNYMFVLFFVYIELLIIIMVLVLVQRNDVGRLEVLFLFSFEVNLLVLVRNGMGWVKNSMKKKEIIDLRKIEEFE